VAQNDICQRVGISAVTLTKWKNDNGWEAKRAAKTISVDELISKTLKRINDLLESPDFNADGFAKAVNQLKALKGSNTVNDVIECFTVFSQWIVEQRPFYPDQLTDAFIKNLTYWQDQYVQYRLGNVKGQ
jgi:esterase/lipase superfamily enzyme